MIRPEDLISKFQHALSEKWGYIWGTAGVKWTQAKQEAATREQTIKYGKQWIGHMVADCSGLFSWSFKQLGGDMYHGSNTMYLKWCTDKGKLEHGRRTDGKDMKPGTAVFCYDGSTYSHVGLFVGGGKVIEAACTRQGVTSSAVTDTKWKYWGELKGVDYSGQTPAPEPQPEPVTKPTIRRGDKGEYVTLAQTLLNNRGYNLGRCGIDGDFGAATQAAVKQFQEDWNLVQDGVVGPKTWQYLESTPTSQLYSVTVYHLTKSQAGRLKAEWPDSSIAEE